MRIYGFLETQVSYLPSSSPRAAMRTYILLCGRHNEALGAIDNPWSLHCLIHDLAVTFGVVQLSPLDIHVWGEWQGKQTEDYELERVKIDIGESIPFLDKFTKQAERCGKIIDATSVD